MQTQTNAYIQASTRARSASAQSTSNTLIAGGLETVIASGERAGFPDPQLGAVTVSTPEALKKTEVLTAAGGLETVIASGERAGFPDPELGVVTAFTPEALKAGFKKTYDPSILVARPAST